ncbi:MAG: hypothetical protein H6814_01190 [Phycisphaeraceae bacterium]|nr:hypothetical protein [Phycisphaeraceae bacterium]
MSVAMLGGCVESRGFHEGRGAASVETDCPFDAADMRLHPLSRIVWTTPGGGDAAEPALDAHIEIVDAWGDTAKALGVFRLELRRTGLREGDLSDAVRWEVDLRDPSTNSAKFDRVTQTYLLRLADLPAWVSNDPYAVLNATFVRLDGVSMNSTLRISARAN